MPRMHAEGMPGAMPDSWFAPDSKTGDSAGEGLCIGCLHQAHGRAVCGYRSTAPDGNGVVECTCQEPDFS